MSLSHPIIEPPSSAPTRAVAKLGVQLTKRLTLICGKGGVGKTTVACALALRAARSGERVLLAGIDSMDQISRYFGVPELGLREVELEPDLFGIHLDEQLVFDSFIRKTFRFKAIYRRILESPIYQYFTAAAPGIKELIVLDSVQELARHAKPPYQHVLLDCPATGHGLSYLDVGNQTLRTFRFGPLHRKAVAIQNLLTNQSETGVILVTLAEEMPVNEALEQYRALRGRLQIAVDALVVNGLFPELVPKLDSGALERLRDAAPIFAAPALATLLAEAGLFYSARSGVNSQHLRRLERELQVPRVEVPFLPNEAKDLAFLLEVGEILGGRRSPNP
jgi:anion-transporting  ArsA/GET3 family ATPase